MSRKDATGWRTTRRTIGERGAGCRFSVTVGMIWLLSRSVLSNRRARIQVRRFGCWLLLPIYVNGPYTEGHDAGREVAHGAQAQECPHARRRCTNLRCRTPTLPSSRGLASAFAAATASWIARLIPTPPTGDMAWAASPMHNSPGRCQRLSLSSDTDSSFTC